MKHKDGVVCVGKNILRRVSLDAPRCGHRSLARDLDYLGTGPPPVSGKYEAPGLSAGPDLRRGYSMTDEHNETVEEAYERGKAAAYNEVAYHDRASHPASCPCRPCRMWDGVRLVVMAPVMASVKAALRPDQRGR